MGLLERRNEFFPVLFSPDPPPRHLNGDSRKGLSLKAVQEAIKTGTATAELLQEAVAGIIHREERAKEIDRQKIQVQVHKQFDEAIQDISFNNNPTEADIVATRLLI